MGYSKFFSMKWYSFAGIGIAIVVAGIGITIQALRLTPADWLVEEVAGVDSYTYHRPFFGDREVRRSFKVTSPTLSRIDVLIVDLKRKSNHTPITLELYLQNSSEVLRKITVPGEQVRDDYYLPFSFTPIENAAGRDFTFTLKAPNVAADFPYAVRVTPDKQGIAYSYFESRNQLFIVQHWLEEHRQKVTILFVTMVLAGLTIWLIPQAARSRRWLRVSLGLVLLFGTLFQLNLIPLLTGDAGGDAYYYLVAAKQISQGINPLAQWSLRLPFYPLLLLPAVSTHIPDLLWGRLLGVGITIGIALALLALARELRLPAVVAVAAMAWLYFNTSFVITSLRPRPYTLFGFLLLLSTTLVFRVRTRTHALLWGTLLGIMGMTRQEAYVPIMILGAGYLVILLKRQLSWRLLVQYLLLAAWPLLLIISPYFYANYKDQGNPFSSSYFNRSDIPLPASFDEFWHNHLVRARNSLATVWLPSTQVRIRTGLRREFIGIMVAMVLLRLLRRRLPNRADSQWMIDVGSAFVMVFLAMVFVRWLFFQGPSWTQSINILVVAAMILGGAEIIRVGRWRGVLVMAVLLSQLVTATLFHPAPKHYQQTYPFLALGIAAVLLPLAGVPTRQEQLTSRLPVWRQSLRLAPLVLLLSLLGIVTLQQYENAIDDQNYPAAPFYVTTAAAEELEQYPPGQAAAEVDYAEGDGMYRLHSYQQLQLTPLAEHLPSAGQWKWLCQHHIRYLVDHDDLSLFTIHEEPVYARYFKFLFEKKAPARDNRLFRVRVFELPPRSSCDIVRV